MNYSKGLSLLLGLALLVASCTGSKKLVDTTITEQRNLDTLVVTPEVEEVLELAEGNAPYIPNELEKYNASHTRINDLIHTKLNLKFDWENESVIGVATLTLKPHFYNTRKLFLDAKNFTFNKISFQGQNSPLKYDYDGKQLAIDLGKDYQRNETYTVVIDYVAQPTEEGGSDAITSDKGLFFINPRGEEPNKPTQIWTQGQTEHNSRWFPTIDDPIERCTQEMHITVEDKYETLSNGLLISSTPAGNGMKTDYWKMDQPHAPYLFMLAVGEYAVVKDKWKNIAVDYYVEPKYEADARRIFPHTPEMLEFFSNTLEVQYPWKKYAQIIVRDYVSGAMENTTASIFGDFIQQTERSLIDELYNDKIVAHELFHHWFGDYVTCESWANLTLNEGFANYSEYLWIEHKYGKDEADYHLMEELEGYLGSAQNGGIHDLIYFDHDSKEDMFDAHSYNKGGLVLHLLRKQVGDEAFFASLNKYLTDNALSDVEGHELRMAFEDMTGQDLNWFFNQWYYNQGQPSLDIKYDYDEATKMVIINVEQLQDPEEMPAIFDLPMAVDIYQGGKKIRKDIRINQRSQQFTFPVNGKPNLVNLDAEKVLIGTKTENKTAAEYAFQYNNAPNFLDRYEALEALSGETEGEAIFEKALNDNFHAIRALAISEINPTKAGIAAKLEKLAESDPHSSVRVGAMEVLAETGDTKYIDLAKRIIDKDRSYDAVGMALETLSALDKTAAQQYASKLAKEEDASILNAVGTIYSDSEDIQYLSFFEDNWSKIDGFEAISFMGKYVSLLQGSSLEEISMSGDKLKNVATNMGQSPWRRLGAMKSINDLHAMLSNELEVTTDETEKNSLMKIDSKLLQLMETIKGAETMGQLKAIYANFPNPPAQP